MESPTPLDNALSNPRTLKRTKRHPTRQWHLSSLFILTTVLSSYSHADVVRSEANEAGVMVIRNAGVGSDELKLADLRAIFAVRKRSWENKAPIKVYVLPDSHGLHQRFCKSVLKVYPYVLREQWDRLLFSGTGIPPITVGSEEELIALVNATSGAIGYAAVDTQKGMPSIEKIPPKSSELESEASTK